ncbi:MAG: glycosyltransferase [Acidobacteriales bacterium]|nr:glycosyltransferase [Terriglobales bacterium]
MDPVKDIVCFANDWSADPLSKKHVMVRFAKDRKVLWINSINNRAPRVGARDFKRILEKLGQFRTGLREVQSNIWVLAPIFVPYHGNKVVRAFNRWFLRRQIMGAIRKLGLQAYVSWAYVPTAADVAGRLGAQALVYHCVDEYSAFSDAASVVAARERELIQACDLVVTSSLKLQESKSALNPNCHLVPHGVDYEHFRKSSDPSLPIAAELKDLSHPVLGFHGLIADWVDVRLIAELAQRRPEWSIVVIGKIDTGISAWSAYKNIRVLGHRPYDHLPEYLRGFDVAILPFVMNELTIAANPLKLREYLAAGLPVVSAPLPEVLRFGPLVRTGATAAEYEKHILELLSSGRQGPDPKQSAAMEKESWDHKVRMLDELLKGIPATSPQGTRKTSGP